MTVVNSSIHARQDSLADQAWLCLLEPDADNKLHLVQRLAQAWHEGKLMPHGNLPTKKLLRPGMPEQLSLVHPAKVARRRLGTPEGQVALLHAVAHIEFTAINLALDAIYRFRDQPVSFYADWLRVACEECYHFGLIRHLLLSTGHDYGDLPAHEGLWDVAVYTDDDLLRRMALVPRVLEARGLDVTPGLIEKVIKVGDYQFADILQIILRDEIGHVATGSFWFNHECHQQRLDTETTFNAIIRQYKHDMNAHIKGPFHIQARQAAGFSQQELEQLLLLESA